MNLLFQPKVNVFLNTLDERTNMLSVVLRDGVDNLGRSYVAYKRDPNDGRERLIEENITTVIWGFGIKVMKNYVYDPLVKALFSNLRYPAMDMSLLKEGAHQLSKKVVEDYAPQDKHLLELVQSKSLQKMYHTSNVARFLITTGTPIALIALGIPTFNQWLTRKKVAQTAHPPQPSALYTGPALQRGQRFAAFGPVPQQPVAGAWGSHPAGVQFGGLSTALSHIIQNDRWNNLFLDGSITSGRTYKARNLWERLEVLVQEAGTIFFLYFAQGMIQRGLEKVVDKLTGSLSGMGFREIKSLWDKFKDNPRHYKNRYTAEVAPLVQELSHINEIKSLWEQFKANPTDFKAKYPAKAEMLLRELPLLKPDAQAETLVHKVREYVKAGHQDNLLYEMAKKADWIPTLPDGTNDLTRKIQTDRIEQLASQLKRLAEHETPLPQILKRSMGAKGGVFLVSSAICSFFLGYAIPRLKQEMTYRLTGSRAFPGVMTAPPAWEPSAFH